MPHFELAPKNFRLELISAGIFLGRISDVRSMCISDEKLDADFLSYHSATETCRSLLWSYRSFNT
jgi:hypothetical protein